MVLFNSHCSLKLHDKAAALFEKIIAEDAGNFEATISLAHVCVGRALAAVK